MTRKIATTILFGLALSTVLTGCGTNHGKSGNALQQKNSTSVNNGNTTGKSQNSKAKSPSGDIPDSQVFIKYSNAQGGYQLEVPEGWSQKVQGSSVSYKNQLDGLKVSVSKSSSAPTVKSVQAKQVTALKNSGNKVKIKKVKSITRKSGKAVLIVYNSDSKPNSVTGKRKKLENNTYIYYKNGKVASLRLWAPLGADNVDQWNRISNSFRWQ